MVRMGHARRAMVTPHDNSSAVKLLVTAFGAFPGMPANPSARLVTTLDRLHRQRLARLGVRLTTAELPVVFATIGEALEQLVEAARPDAIIHVGVAARRSTLSIEARAQNRIGILRTDAARALSAAPAVSQGRPSQLRSRWPAARLVSAMNRVGVATRISIDAGDYVCNQTLYLTLLTTQIPAGFLHIPKPRTGQRRKRGIKARKPSLSEMVRALAQAVLVMSMEVRRRS